MDAYRLVTETFDSLAPSGYRRATDIFDEQSFGNRVIEITNNSTTVRSTLDRSIWTTELISTDFGSYEWDVWRACLTGEPPAYDASNLAEQMLFVATVVPQLDDLVARAGPHLGDCLESTARSMRLIQKIRNWRRFEADEAP
jgi:hypothetical protein